jgi:integral membrane sensor domain MASE1
MATVMVIAGLNLACRVAAMFAAASAARFRFALWREAGRSQMQWMIGPLLGALVFAPLGLAVAIGYVARVRPELQELALRDLPKSF